jgi:hypothetical protein
VPLASLHSKTLQLNVWSVAESGSEECMGCTQISLADFSLDSAPVSKWQVHQRSIFHSTSLPYEG